EWVSKAPDSYCSHLALANHYHERGWSSRGHGWASETSKSQFEGMEHFFDLAQSESERALKINPHLLIAYIYLGDIAIASGDHHKSKEWYEKGSSQMPYSFLLRAFHMGYLAPRWGGSYEEMKKFADECDIAAAHNRNLKILRGYVDHDRG